MNCSTFVASAVLLALLGLAVAGDYAVEEKKCYDTGEKCCGELGYPRIDYKPCCKPHDYCAVSSKSGDWGSYCSPIEEKYHYYSYSPYEKKCYATGERCAGLVDWLVIYQMPCCDASECCAKVQGKTYSECVKYVEPNVYDKKPDYKPPPPVFFKKPYYDDHKKPSYDDYKKPYYDDYKKPYYGDYKKPYYGDYKKPPYDDYKKPSYGDYKKPSYDDYKKKFKKPFPSPKY